MPGEISRRCRGIGQRGRTALDLLRLRSELRNGRTIFDLPLRVTFYARVSTDKAEQRSSLDHQVQYYTQLIASRPATACLCADGCSPYPSFLKAGSWPAHSHTAFLSDAYRTYPVDLFNYRTVASPHKRTTRCTCADLQQVQNFPQIEGSFHNCLFIPLLLHHRAHTDAGTLLAYR